MRIKKQYKYKKKKQQHDRSMQASRATTLIPTRQKNKVFKVVKEIKARVYMKAGTP